MRERDLGIVSETLKTGDGATTVCLCGVMARGSEQFGPIVDSLPGTVIALHAEGRRYDADMLHWRALELLKSADPHQQFNFVGASLGGDEVPYLVNYFLESRTEVDPANVHAVMIDAPAGLDTLVDPMAKLMKFKAVSETVATLTSFMNTPVQDKALPKHGQITIPPDYQGTDDQYEMQVRADARRFMAGHKFSLLQRQTHRMIDVWDSGELPKMCMAIDPEVRVTYLACREGNDVVRQPAAVSRFDKCIEQLERVDVFATHCGFLQNQPEFQSALDDVFIPS